MELDIRHLFVELVRKWWIIMLVAILFAIGSIGYTFFFITPVYSSTTQIYVLNNPDRVQITQGDISASANMVMTYVEILKSNTVLEAVSDYLETEKGLKYSASSIKSMLSFSTVKDTEIFKLRVTCANKNHAPIIADAMFEVGQDYVVDITQAGGVKQIDKANIPTGRSAPSYRSNTMAGAFIGAIAMALIIVLFTIFDTRIKSLDDITQSFTLPVFGVIPTYNAPPSHGIEYRGVKEDGKEGN